MKKRGLIVATIVMVLVLAVSLTTATYAWFAATATAQVTNFTVSAGAADGLQIASIYYAEGATQLRNGSLTVEEATHRWTNAETTSFGNTVDIGGLLAMRGVTGDGLTMYTDSTADGTHGADGSISGEGAAALPAHLTTATPNVEFFTIDLAIQCSSVVTGTRDFSIKTLTVQGTGNMAATSRIAFYQIDPDGDGAASAGAGSLAPFTASAVVPAASAGKPVLLIEPYYNWSYAGGVLTPGATTTPAALTYRTIASYSAPAVTYASSAEATLAPINTIKGTAELPTTVVASEAWDTNANADATVSDITVGSFTAQNQIVYLRMAIWFEGSDAECLIASANSGLTVGMTFELKATA